MVGPSEILNYEEETVDLITVCQAVHWFDIPKFYQEVNRVLKPSGVLAIIGYHCPNVCENIGVTLEQAQWARKFKKVQAKKKTREIK